MVICLFVWSSFIVILIHGDQYNNNLYRDHKTQQIVPKWLLFSVCFTNVASLLHRVNRLKFLGCHFRTSIHSSISLTNNNAFTSFLVIWYLLHSSSGWFIACSLRFINNSEQRFGENSRQADLHYVHITRLPLGACVSSCYSISPMNCSLNIFRIAYDLLLLVFLA